MVLNSFIMHSAFTRLVRARLAGLHGFPGAWRRCNCKRRQWITIARRCASCAHTRQPYGLGTRAAGCRVCPAPGKPHTPARSTELSRLKAAWDDNFRRNVLFA
ncbi:MAG: hypothetical protein WC091_24955 [Sulfuricellaceae bacterium]